MENEKKDEAVNNRYDFVLLFDVKDGNPNGDPDAGNLPRVDPETGHGIVTDVSLKRKIRNYVMLTKENKEPYRIFVEEKAILNNTLLDAFKNVGVDATPKKDTEEYDTEKKKELSKHREEARDYLCKNYYDIRAFGAVMSTGPNAGQVRGPVQLTFGRSVDPVVTLEHSITRMAVTTKKDAEGQGGDNRTMGRKFTVPYGLYKAYGFVSAPLASQTHFTEEDLELLWTALTNMFDHDRSAARGIMNTRKLVIFKHSSKMGDAHAQDLFDKVSVTKKDKDKPARDYSDYDVKVSKEGIPGSVTLIEK